MDAELWLLLLVAYLAGLFTGPVLKFVKELGRRDAGEDRWW